MPHGQGLSHALLITKWVHHVFAGLAKLGARSVLAVMARNHTVVASSWGVVSAASVCLAMAFPMGLERSQPVLTAVSLVVRSGGVVLMVRPCSGAWCCAGSRKKTVAPSSSRPSA